MKKEYCTVSEEKKVSKAKAATKIIQLLVADDHLVYRIGIRNLLGSEPGFEVIGEAADGNLAIELYRRLRPDVLLLDLRMPQKGGLEVVRAVRSEFSNARILVLTSYRTEEEIFQALEAGALGYVLKDVGRETLVQAILAVHAGNCWLAPAIRKQYDERVLRQQLTPREVEILKLIARGLTNQEIANVNRISASTVKNHMNSIMAKLDLADRTEAVSFCLSRGILNPEDL